MKTDSPLNQVLPSILISAVLGILLAVIIGVSALDILAYGFRRQLFDLALLSFCLGVFSYLLLARFPIRSKTPSALYAPGWGAVTRKISFWPFSFCSR